MQKYTGHKVTHKRKHTKHAHVTRRNVRANARQKAKQASFLLKVQKRELDQAAAVARLIAAEAVEAGVVPPAGGAGAPAEEIMNVEVNLAQAVAIANAVAGHADNPAPIQEQIRVQAEQVQKRGHGCSFIISVRGLFHVLMALSVLYSTQYPIVASPRETTFFDTAAGYLAIGGSAASLLSFDSAGIYTMCGIGMQALGAASRFASSAAGVHPMTPYEKKRELLKLAEYTPSGPGVKYFQLKKISGIGHLARDAHRKTLSVLPKIKESFSKAVVNIDENVAESLGMSRSDVVERPNLVTKKVIESFIPSEGVKAPIRRRIGLATTAIAAAALTAGLAAKKTNNNNNNNNNNNEN